MRDGSRPFIVVYFPWCSCPTYCSMQTMMNALTHGQIDRDINRDKHIDKLTDRMRDTGAWNDIACKTEELSEVHVSLGSGGRFTGLN